MYGLNQNLFCQAGQSMVATSVADNGLNITPLVNENYGIKMIFSFLALLHVILIGCLREINSA